MALITWRGGGAQNRNTLKSSAGRFRNRREQMSLLVQEDRRSVEGDGCKDSPPTRSVTSAGPPPFRAPQCSHLYCRHHHTIIAA